MSGMSEPILGRPSVESLRINTRALLASAMVKVGTSLEVSDLDGFQGFPGGSVARIFNEGLYH